MHFRKKRAENPQVKEKNLIKHVVQISHLVGKGTEAQKGDETCPERSTAGGWPKGHRNWSLRAGSSQKLHPGRWKGSSVCRMLLRDCTQTTHRSGNWHIRALGNHQCGTMEPQNQGVEIIPQGLRPGLNCSEGWAGGFLLHFKIEYFLFGSVSDFSCRLWDKGLSKGTSRASLVVQWLRICLPMQGTRVRALGWEDPTCRGATRPVSHSCWACASGTRAPQQERPRHWKARAPQWRVAPTCHN